MDKMLKADYNVMMKSPDVPDDLTYEAYKQAITYTRSFDYKSIEDSQISREFWTNLAIGAGILVVGVFCPPAGIALGIGYGTLELGSAAAGKDWLTGRELGNGERVMRGAFALIDIIPGAKAFEESMDVARVATGLLGQSDNVLQVMGKYTLQRTKNLVGQMGRAGRNTKAFIKLLGSNADEAAQMFITKADELGRQVINLGKGKIDDIGTKLDDLAAKGEKILSGDFGDVKKYFKSLLPGEYTLVATPDGQVFRIAKGELGETSLELAARNGDGVARARSKGAGEAIEGAGTKTINTVSAEDVNTSFVKKGMEAPYKPGTQTNTIEFTKNIKVGEYVRVYTEGKTNPAGQWFMKAEDIKGLTPAQIQAKFALPSTPTHVSDVIFNTGDVVRTGVANEAFGFRDEGIQYDLMGQRIGTFTNSRPLQSP